MPLLEVTSPALVRQFLDLPARLYQNQPQWISPLDHEIEAVFDPKKNPNFAHGEAIRWVLTDAAGTVIGRVAAFINRHTPQTDPTQPVGGMGFFECIDDQAAANDLFEACRRWLAERPRWWRARVQLVAIDMSAEFRAAVRFALPRAVITVDHFHVVARANQMITEVRRRRSQTLHGRRGRNSDPAYRYRKLLTCNQENLSVAARGRSWARGRDHPHRPGTQCRVGHQGARPATAADRGHQRLPAGVGRARARGEGHPDAQGQIALREPESPAPAPSGLLPHPSHQRP